MIYIETIAKFSLFLPICIFLFFTKSKEKYRWFLFFYIFLFFSEQIASVLNKHINGIFDWVTLLSLPIQITVLFFFFKETIKSTFHIKVIAALSFIFLLIWIVKNWNSGEFNSTIKVSSSIVVIISCLLYYYGELKRLDSFFVYTKPEFWGVTAIFIFTAGTFFVFLFRQQSLDIDRTFYNQYVYIHAFLFITRNLLLSVSFLLKSKTHVLSHI